MSDHYPHDNDAPFRTVPRNLFVLPAAYQAALDAEDRRFREVVAQLGREATHADPAPWPTSHATSNRVSDSCNTTAPSRQRAQERLLVRSPQRSYSDPGLAVPSQPPTRTNSDDGVPGSSSAISPPSKSASEASKTPRTRTTTSLPTPRHDPDAMANSSPPLSPSAVPATKQQFAAMH